MNLITRAQQSPLVSSLCSFYIHLSTVVDGFATCKLAHSGHTRRTEVNRKPFSLLPMTFAVLRSLHTIIGDALDDMERVYSSHGQASTPDSSSGRLSPQETVSSTTTSTSTEILGRSPALKPGRNTSLSKSQAYASPPPSPSIATSSESMFPPPSTSTLDFPSLDNPYDPNSASETLTTHPTVLAAISRLVAAAGQMTATVQAPFLTICDAVMGVRLGAHVLIRPLMFSFY